MTTADQPTVRGLLRALGLSIGADELDGRWGIDAKRRIESIPELLGAAHQAERQEQREEAEEARWLE